MMSQPAIDRMAAHLDGISRATEPGTPGYLPTASAVEIARKLLLEVDRYRRVESVLRVLCEEDGPFGAAAMMRLADVDPEDAPPVLCVSVVDVLGELDRNSSPVADETSGRSPWDLCPCGHPWILHDIEDHEGDGSDTCCVEGCSQVGCPGKSS